MDNRSALEKQYDSIKAKYPDNLILFRIGDFYEMFKDDAVVGSKVIGTVLTKRNQLSLSGFPHFKLEEYLPKLLKAGLKVAIVEQLEELKFAINGNVKRDVAETINQPINNIIQKGNTMSKVKSTSVQMKYEIVNVREYEFPTFKGKVVNKYPKCKNCKQPTASKVVERIEKESGIKSSEPYCPTCADLLVKALPASPVSEAQKIAQNDKASKKVRVRKQNEKKASKQSKNDGATKVQAKEKKQTATKAEATATTQKDAPVKRTAIVVARQSLMSGNSVAKTWEILEKEFPEYDPEYTAKATSQQFKALLSESYKESMPEGGKRSDKYLTKGK